METSFGNIDNHTPTISKERQIYLAPKTPKIPPICPIIEECNLEIEPLPAAGKQEIKVHR
jgi:hypothetical protein